MVQNPVSQGLPVPPGEPAQSSFLEPDKPSVTASATLPWFDGTLEDGQAALESLGLGERLPAVLSDFEKEFSAIKPCSW